MTEASILKHCDKELMKKNKFPGKRFMRTHRRAIK